MDNIERLRLLSDIEVNLSLFIGFIEKNIDYLLSLKEGDIIELNKNIEDYLEVYLENKSFGKGELVIVNDKYSFRLIDLVR